MNPYWYNEIRRATEWPVWKKVLAWLYAVLNPTEMERKWANHANHMQMMLNLTEFEV